MDAISAQITQTGGGSIDIQARELVTLINSEIITTVADGDQNAGNITLSEPVVLTLVNGSRI